MGEMMRQGINPTTLRNSVKRLIHELKYQGEHKAARLVQHWLGSVLAPPPPEPQLPGQTSLVNSHDETT